MNSKSKVFSEKAPEKQQKPTQMVDARKAQALGHLLSGANVSKCAELVGCHRDTIRKFLSDKEFSSELQRLLDEQLQSVSHACTALALESMATLGGIQRDAGASEMARIKCAEIILERAGDGQRLASIQKRLDVLQDRMAS